MKGFKASLVLVATLLSLAIASPMSAHLPQATPQHRHQIPQQGVLLTLRQGISSQDRDRLSEQLIKEIKRLDPDITGVRPSLIQDGNLKTTVWMPAIFLRKDISLKRQKEIAWKAAEYVVRFNQGVQLQPPEIYGGIILFVKGENWTPALAHLSYSIVSRQPLKVEVWTNYMLRDQQGRVTDSCCEEGELVGRVEGDRLLKR